MVDTQGRTAFQAGNQPNNFSDLVVGIPEISVESSPNGGSAECEPKEEGLDVGPFGIGFVFTSSSG
jgi:hypothetical protein